MTRYVIVGAGQAGRRAAEALAAEAAGAAIVLLGDEPYPPYNRPPLSKQVLTDEIELARVFQRAADDYAALGVTFRPNSRVLHIDWNRKLLELAGAAPQVYDKLLLCTGSRPRRLDLPGADDTRVLTLRTIDDALAIRALLGSGRRLVIIGGGFIGMEVAASARRMGSEVVVLEAAERLMARAMPPLLSGFVQDMHLRHGVALHLGVQLHGFERQANGLLCVLSSAGAFACEAALVGVGVQPNVELAADAGLKTDNGIVVDEYGRTDDPDIFAAGDVTNHYNPLLQRYLRVESWQVAQNQPPLVAKNMAGQHLPYAELPWLWSDQYDCNIQTLGLFSPELLTVLRGSVDSGRFILLGLGPQLQAVAAVCVNRGRDMPALRRLVLAGQPVLATRFADESVPLDQLSV